MNTTDYWKGWFENGIAKISKDGLVGLIDDKGAILCPVQYDLISRFYHGVAVVTLNNKYGIINQKGEEILSPSLSLISSFEKGFAWFYEEEEGVLGMIGTDGKILFETENDAIRKYQNDDFVFIGESLVNTSGEEIFKLDLPAFASVKGERANFSNMEDYVTQSRLLPFFKPEWLFHRTTPQRFNMVPPDLFFYFQEGKMLFPEPIDGLVKLGYRNTKGEVNISAAYDNAHHFINGMACVKQGGLWGVIDESGTFVIPCKYEYLERTPSDYFLLGKEGKFGLINASGKIVLEPEYLRIEYLFDQVFALLKNTPAVSQRMQMIGNQKWDTKINTWGALNMNSGKTILPFTYHRILSVDGKFGLGVNYQFSEYSLGGSPFDSQNSAIPDQKKIIGKGLSQIFNSTALLGKYESIGFEFFGIHQGTSLQIQAINLYDQVAGFYNFNGTLLNEDGRPLGEEKFTEWQEKTNSLKRVIHQDQATDMPVCKNLEGGLIIPPICQELRLTSTGVIGRKEKQWMFFDLMGNEILPPIYDQIEETSSGVLSVRLDDNTFWVDKKGNKIN